MMGYPAKIQLIKRKASEQWFINFPSAVARAMEFEPSETLEWVIEDKSLLVLRRIITPPSTLKKKHPSGSSNNSSRSGKKPKAPSVRKGPGSEPKA